MSDSVSELVGETISNIIRCSSYFVVECYGNVECGWRCSGSQVFALLMLFLSVILYTMWSCKRLQLLCILRFGILCLSPSG